MSDNNVQSHVVARQLRVSSHKHQEEIKTFRKHIRCREKDTKNHFVHKEDAIKLQEKKIQIRRDLLRSEKSDCQTNAIESGQCKSLPILPTDTCSRHLPTTTSEGSTPSGNKAQFTWNVSTAPFSDIDNRQGTEPIKRERALSVCDPEQMTEDELKIYELMESALPDEIAANKWDKRRVCRVYKETSSKSDNEYKPAGNHTPKVVTERPLRLPPVLLPSISQQKSFLLTKRNLQLSSSSTNQITDALWEDLRECRYLRFPIKRTNSSSTV